MNNIHKLALIAAFAAATSTLTNCSSGGGGNDDPPPSSSSVGGTSSGGGSSSSAGGSSSSAGGSSSSVDDTPKCGGATYDTSAKGCCNATLFTLEDEMCDSRDKQIYSFVTIGEQVWLARNLNYEEDGSECYDNDEENCDDYGRLYNWEIANNICPDGWKLPSQDEWDDLISYVENAKNCPATTCAGKYLKANSDLWNTNIDIEDYYGFGALPGGGGYGIDYFTDIKEYGGWWSSTGSTSAANNLFMGSSIDNAYWVTNSKEYSFSVRCLKE